MGKRAGPTHTHTHKHVCTHPPTTHAISMEALKSASFKEPLSNIKHMQGVGAKGVGVTQAFKSQNKSQIDRKKSRGTKLKEEEKNGRKRTESWSEGAIGDQREREK